ncbi:antitoxin Xre-like helix-turn-helix domain-containing protein [Cupriavidus plantarum]|uniref:antitoxin Xre-like helix-turn-helix domain-containing protein n=1 Tax=Cupriavidus plantarum TaxID=942865 RepID=UPI000EAC7704|nr:antitoxin Xre-like helix-turn-helix domain-containing protein [Cupriavidus plantarum]RLK31670.1 putative toxin-antitoxin system antitoxin component (TIGR02293 family) [Cupriavidus plantarum]
MPTIAFHPSGARAPYERYLEDLSAFLSTKVRGGADLATLASDRLPAETLERLLETGLSWDEVAFIIPRRTLSHRREKGQPLTVEESDKAIRLARILALAVNTFGDVGRGLNWLRQKQQRFGGVAPLALAGTEQGAHLVEEQLVQIDEGYFA